jgi:uncharacterized membrane protein
MMPNLQWAYWLVGALFAVFSLLSAFDPANPKRWRNTLFWGLVATSFLVGHLLSDLANGGLVLALALLAGLGGLGLGKPKTTTPQERVQRAARWGNGLFVLALVVPAVTFGLSLFLILPPLVTGQKLTIAGQPFLGAEQPTVVALVIGITAGLVAATLWLRARPITLLQEGRRLIDQVGWAVVLPQALAALGGVFAAAKVGEAVGGLTSGWLPPDNGLIAVVAYTVGMALFTIVMGNAFAAFPIMTAAIGLPLIVGRLHGDPVIMAAIGMLSGFCGTLMTPMAANFNVVPAQLLELPDRGSIFNGVIRAQAPTGAIMLLINTLLMYALVFRF